jgi:DNA-directed RNA polymerase specialized sigma24 family protein
MKLEKLLKALIKKNRKAQKLFYDRYADRLFSAAYRYVKNESDAGSIVNYSFFKILTIFQISDIIMKKVLLFG